MPNESFKNFGLSYLDLLSTSFNDNVWRNVDCLYDDLLQCWKKRNRVFLYPNPSPSNNLISKKHTFKKIL